MSVSSSIFFPFGDTVPSFTQHVFSSPCFLEENRLWGSNVIYIYPLSILRWNLLPSIDTNTPRAVYTFLQCFFFTYPSKYVFYLFLSETSFSSQRRQVRIGSLWSRELKNLVVLYAKLFVNIHYMLLFSSSFTPSPLNISFWTCVPSKTLFYLWSLA